MRTGAILITGASSGIGLACAKRVAALGYSVYAGIRSAQAGECVEANVPGATPVILDVCQPESIASAVAALEGQPLAGLINSAGIATLGPLEMVPIDEWRRQFDVNVIGTVAVTQACLPFLRRSKGRIVNIGSVAGRSALPGTGAYDSSKFALEGISDSLRLELRQFGIHVSLIEPGAIATGIWNKSVAELDRRTSDATPEARESYGSLISKLRDETLKSATNSQPPDATADAVAHALTAPHPKARYVVGSDARVWLLLNLLPDRLRDWLILRELSERK